ncbi:LysE family transporter [Rhizobium beringeri]
MSSAARSSGAQWLRPGSPQSLTRYAEALTILKIFGGLYLLYLAFRAARAALTAGEKPAEAAGKGILKRLHPSTDVACSCI